MLMKFSKPGTARFNLPVMKLPHFSAALAGIFALSMTAAARAALDTNGIERITGLQGTWNSVEGVFKISRPRNDVSVKIDGRRMPPFMGIDLVGRSSIRRESLGVS